MKKIIVILGVIFAVSASPVLAATHYSRTGNAPGVVTLNFSFDDWTTDMDFTDINDNNQTYWAIQVVSNSENGVYTDRGTCNPSTTLSDSFSPTLPNDETEYPIEVHAQRYVDLTNCQNDFGGALSLETIQWPSSNPCTNVPAGINTPEKVGCAIEKLNGSVSDNGDVVFHKVFPYFVGTGIIVAVWFVGKRILFTFL